MKISVILAVFNGEKYLKNSIESFLAQDYSDKELIIIDDKSIDASHDIIAKYQKKHPDLIKWIQEKDSGISDARNIAVKYATGDIIGFLGVDDALHKDFFAQISYYHSVNSEYDIMYFNGYSISKEVSYFNHSANIPVTFRNLCKYTPIASGECFYYKKHIFDDFSFNQKNKYTMDYEFNLKLCVANKSFFGVNFPAIFNISDGKNISAENNFIQRIETIAIQLHYAPNFAKKLIIILRRPRFFLKFWFCILKINKSLW